MCMFQPKQQVPILPPETAAMKQPDSGAVRTAVGRRTEDRIRGGANTILTSGEGVMQQGMTDKKTLLGQ